MARYHALVLLDLGTGRWLRCAGRRTNPDLGTVDLREEATTLDAFGRPRAKDVPRTGTTAYSASRLVPLVDGSGPFRGAIVARVHEEPSYDSEWCREGDHQVTFFTNLTSFYNCPVQYEGPFKAKQWGRDVNLVGQGGMPAGHQHELDGFTVCFLGSDGAPCSRALVERLVGQGYFEFQLVGNRWLVLPLAAVVPEVVERVGESVGDEVQHAPPPAYPLLLPFRLQQLEYFRVRISWPNGCPATCLVRVELGGLHSSGIAG